MSALLALLAAVGFGVSDFVAGLASRRLHFVWVTVVGQVFATAVVVLLLARFGGAGPAAAALAWGACSGIGSAGGTLALYRGYGHGEMAVAGPLSAIGAALLPAFVDVASGERQPPLGTAGVVLAMPAIWLMSRAPGHDHGRLRAGVVDGVVSGACFGLLFVALDRAGSGHGLWPVAAGDVTALALLGIATAVMRPPWPRDRGARAAQVRLPLVAGVLGAAALVCFFLATHHGALTIAAVLTSLYPGVTVALAAALLHERPSRRQLLGLGLGAVAVVAIVTA